MRLTQEFCYRWTMASVLFLISWAVLMGVWPYSKCSFCVWMRGLRKRLNICNSLLSRHRGWNGLVAAGSVLVWLLSWVTSQPARRMGRNREGPVSE